MPQEKLDDVIESLEEELLESLKKTKELKASIRKNKITRITNRLLNPYRQFKIKVSIAKYDVMMETKGFTFFIRPNGSDGHYGMIWSKNSTTMVTIEANSDYYNNYRTVQRIWYYWDSNRQVYYRDDRKVEAYIRLYMPNY